MKKLIKVLLLSFLVMSTIGCGSTPVATENKEETKAPDVETTEITESTTDDVDDEEYLRSTNKLNNGEKITKDQFAKDKADVLRIIEELEVIMAEKDFNSWKTYISSDSRKFYSSPRKINNKGKIQILNGLDDYFVELFIPSREKASINEIRYISSVSVKAVEFTKPKKANERPKIITYYNFVKENDKWYVELPTNIVVN